jgi:hypothetical protein
VFEDERIGATVRSGISRYDEDKIFWGVAADSRITAASTGLEPLPGHGASTSV